MKCLVFKIKLLFIILKTCEKKNVKQQRTGYHRFSNGVLCDHQKSRFRRVFTNMGKCSQYIFSEKADLQMPCILLYNYILIYLCMVYIDI